MCWWKGGSISQFLGTRVSVLQECNTSPCQEQFFNITFLQSLIRGACVGRGKEAVCHSFYIRPGYKGICYKNATLFSMPRTIFQYYLPVVFNWRCMCWPWRGEAVYHSFYIRPGYKGNAFLHAKNNFSILLSCSL